MSFLQQPKRDSTRREARREDDAKESKSKALMQTNRLTDVVALGNCIALNDSKKTLIKREKKKVEVSALADGHKPPNL